MRKLSFVLHVTVENTSARGVQRCGDLHSIKSFNQVAQFLDQIGTKLTALSLSVAIKMSDKIMLEASLE